MIMKQIPLGKSGKFALVDDEDYERVMSMGKWQLGSGGYAQKSIYLGSENGKQVKKTLFMHRFIMDATSDYHVDHKKGNTIDNRKFNLRICGQHQNRMNRVVNKNNRTGYKGVYKMQSSEKFKAQICVSKTNIHLGTFFTIIEAAKAYNSAALKYHGEFANLNKIPECI